MVRCLLWGLAVASLFMPATAGAARPLPGGHYVLTYSSTPNQVSMFLHVSRERDRFVPGSGVGLDPCAGSVPTSEVLSADFSAQVKHPPVKITPQGFFAARWIENDGTDFAIQGSFVTGRLIRGTLSLRKHLGKRICTDLIGVRFRAHWIHLR